MIKTSVYSRSQLRAAIFMIDEALSLGLDLRILRDQIQNAIIDPPVSNFKEHRISKKQKVGKPVPRKKCPDCGHMPLRIMDSEFGFPIKMYQGKLDSYIEACPECRYSKYVENE